MSENIEIIRLHDLPAGIDELVRESIAEGHHMIERLVHDWSSGENRFDQHGEALFGAQIGTTLVGVSGLNRDPFADDANVGRLRRLYVVRSHRNNGVASALTRTVLSLARKNFSRVRVRTSQAGASAFYAAQGFSRLTADPLVTHEIGF
jgi:GNAT superfamily N-acetyltransferase